MCLQETDCTDHTVNKWEKEWKNSGGGESIWNCGSSDSRGVCILLCKKFQYNFTKTFRDCYGRIISFEIHTSEIRLLFKCIYSPNDGGDRKRFFESLSIDEWEEGGPVYSVICGDFNCALDKTIDRHPSHSRNDIGLDELNSFVEINNLCDVWRILNPDKRRYTFKRNNSKSRIDFVLTSKCLLSLLSHVKIQHCPFSDHDLVCVKIKMNEIVRGRGVWVMNEKTITRGSGEPVSLT